MFLTQGYSALAQDSKNGQAVGTLELRAAPMARNRAPTKAL